jgi:hypothetical protein
MKRKLSLILLVMMVGLVFVACQNQTTVAPTTATPTTVAPTTNAPTTVAPTTVAPTTEAPFDGVLFDYDWEDDEWDGEQAFSDGEGDNFMIMGGFANTINNQGVIGPASSWAFGYTPYDMNVGEATIEAKVEYVSSAVVDVPAVFSIRHLYAMHYDLQIFFENGDTYSGVRFYNSSTNVLGESTNLEKGGQLSGQRFVAGEEYVVHLIYDYTGETTTDIYVYVNNILEIYLEDVAIQSPNGKFGIGASIHTQLKVDYFRAVETDAFQPGDIALNNVTLFRGFEFNDDLGTTGASILGDAYAEGTSFATDGEGFLRSQSDNEGTFGPAPGWSSARTGYDMGIPANYIIKFKVHAFSESDGTAMACVRPSHAIYCDFQFVMASEAEAAGVHVYKQGSQWASASGLTYDLNQDYIVTIVFKQISTEHETSDHGTYEITVFIDNTLVLTIEDAESAGPNASIAICTNNGSDLAIDYLRIYGFE